MVGFALSGVVLALCRDAFARHGTVLLAGLPTLLVVAAAIGFHFTTTNPFNPLQLQNPATWLPQIWHIAGYYACLLPFFFLAGLFVSLSFVLNPNRIGVVYAFDLTGAGAGAGVVLAAMFLVHAFFLVPLLLVPLAASAVFVAGRWRWLGAAAAGIALLGGEALLLLDNQAEFNDFKAIYAPLHTPDARVVASVLSPRGDYLLLDDFTERVDTDISNNAGMLGVAGPPRTFGLYRDGNRIAALPRPGPLDVGYAAAALDALPYRLIPHARVLLVGASGGFRVAEILALGASRVHVLEPEPVLLRALRQGLGRSPALAADPRVSLAGDGPVAATRPGGAYDVIDLSADFLDTAEANATAFSARRSPPICAPWRRAGSSPIPVSIRDFPVYALRMLATARAALLEAGIADPSAHTVVYRSAWSVRILLSNRPWDAARIASLRKFCDHRSFDVSWYPGIDLAAARAGIYNDLPAVSFANGEVTSNGPDDSIADEAGAVLAGRPARRAGLQPGADHAGPPVLLRRAPPRPARYDPEAPRDPAAGRDRRAGQPGGAGAGGGDRPAGAAGASRGTAPTAPPAAGLLRPIVYFPALGLGFLFIEIYLIEKASLWLNDRTSGFAVVLTGMLVFSGLGSMAADRMTATPRRCVAVACVVVLGWCAAVLVALQPAILATLDLPWLRAAVLLLAVLAPVSLALGLPFPLGLSRVGSGALLPWAWGLNGAFSVVATPLANLIAREAGFSRVMLSAAMLYVVAVVMFPATRKSSAWHLLSPRSRAAE